VTITVQPGESIGIVDESGSGKTTLINLISGVYRDYTGKILLDGIDVCTLHHDDITQSIAVIPQDTLLSNRTVRENILYGNQQATKAELEAAIRAAAADFIWKLSNGLDTVVGERGNLLSGGQRQRIAIARAILKEC